MSGRLTEGDAMSKPSEPLRGEAAWKAAKKKVADHNEAAYARGRRERAARHAAWVARRQEEARQADINLRKRTSL
jgi:hypothetical protein